MHIFRKIFLNRKNRPMFGKTPENRRICQPYIGVLLSMCEQINMYIGMGKNKTEDKSNVGWVEKKVQLGKSGSA